MVKRARDVSAGAVLRLLRDERKEAYRALIEIASDQDLQRAFMTAVKVLAARERKIGQNNASVEGWQSVYLVRCSKKDMGKDTFRPADLQRMGDPIYLRAKDDRPSHAQMMRLKSLLKLFWRMDPETLYAGQRGGRAVHVWHIRFDRNGGRPLMSGYHVIMPSLLKMLVDRVLSVHKKHAEDLRRTAHNIKQIEQMIAAMNGETRRRVLHGLAHRYPSCILSVRTDGETD